MAEISVSLSGLGGLAPHFYGDNDKTVSEPNLRFAGEAQMVDGYYNPFLRYGYLAPATTTKVDISTSTTPDTFFGSSYYDNVEDEYYFAERGRRIYKGSGLDDESLTEIVELPSGAMIQDLEQYELSGFRKMFYVYESDSSTTTLTTRSDVKGQLYSLNIKADGATGVPIVSFSESFINSKSSFSHEVEVPTSSNVTILVITAGADTVSAVEINSNSFTSDFSETITIADDDANTEALNPSSSDYEFQVWSYNGPASGTQNIDITAGGSNFMHYVVVILEDADTNTVDSVTSEYTLGNSVSVEETYEQDSLYLQYTHALPSLYEISGSTFTNEEEDFSGKVGGDTITGAFAFGDGGSKVYIQGINTGTDICYQFSLSTPWRPSTAGGSAVASYDFTTVAGQYTPHEIKFASTGDTVYTTEINGETIRQHTLGTSWDISSVSSHIDYNFTFTDGDIISFDITEDGTKMYLFVSEEDTIPSRKIYQINLPTPYDLGIATLAGYIDIPLTQDPGSLAHLSLTNGDKALFFKGAQDDDPLRRIILPVDGDITKAVFDGESTLISSTNGQSIVVHPNGNYWYKIRLNGNRELQRFNIPLSSVPALSSVNTTLVDETRDGGREALLTVSRGAGFKIDVGHESIPSGVSVESWLIGEKEQNITSSSRYNFIRKADNGFAYLFTDNRVHKIDGTITGGLTGAFTRNVLTFPDYFTISDAVDYRSQMYIAVNKANLDLSDVNRGNYTGGAYVYVWNRNSVQLSAATSIEIPGVRSIKKIYPGPDGHLKIIVINDAGLTELRRFGYNDSGSAVFSEAVVLGLGAHPQFPDASSVVGDKTVWLANNGTLFAERDMAVFRIADIEDVATLPGDTIKAGAILFGSGTETASSGQRTDKQGILLGYEDSLGNDQIKKVYPFDVTTGDNSNQTPSVGNVYTGVNYLPVTSKVNRVRLYNAPISTSNTDVVATVKLYFNQSTSATMPDGMTKTITKQEAARGYVDFNIRKPYLHSIQLEIEWNDSEPIGDDMYLPSIAIISTEDTNVATPDSD